MKLLIPVTGAMLAAFGLVLIGSHERVRAEGNCEKCKANPDPQTT